MCQSGHKSLVRPNIGRVAPRFIVEDDDDGERSGEFGNPISSHRAWNFDLSAEYDFAPDALVSFAASTNGSTTSSWWGNLTTSPSTESPSTKARSR
jgi:hypothetical protein